MNTDPNTSGGQNEDVIHDNLVHYEKGLELAEAGKHWQALEHMQERLAETPDDAEVLNDTGAILHCLGRSDEAIDHFVKALSVRNDSAEILWNLAEAYLATGKASEATQIFDGMDRMGVLNADVLNRTAEVFLNQDNKAGALEMLLRSLRIWPDQEILHPMVDVIRSKRPKVAFFCDENAMGSVNEISRFVKERFEVRFLEDRSKDQVHELMTLSDISWFEWGSDLAVAGSKQPRTCKNIIGLYRNEGHQQWARAVNWANINVLVAVGDCPVKEESLAGELPGLESQTSIAVIPSGVNLERFAFVNRQRGKNIAFLSDLKAMNNPAFMLQCMQKLHYVDSEYRLFFGGEFEDTAIEQYIRHMVDALDLRDVVFFDGRQEDIRCWLEDKHYIASTSIFERENTRLLEAMACGLKPVVHNFPAANQTFVPEFLFNISEEFCEQICSEQYEPRRYRRFVKENYPLRNQLDKINRILIELEAEIESEQTDGPFCDDLQARTPEEAALSTQSAAGTFEEN